MDKGTLRILMITGGAFMFLLAVGINLIYSIEGVCLLIWNSRGSDCYNGYDMLPDYLRPVLSIRLNLIASAGAGAGAAMLSGTRRQTALI